MKVIVYSSNTGYTKRYAEMLAAKTFLPVYDLKEAERLKKSDEIIYLGWLRAGSIVGFKKVTKVYNVKAVCAVGMAPGEEKTLKDVKERNDVENVALFYLRGGFDMKKLRGINKFMMKTMLFVLKRTKKDGKEDPTRAQMIEGIENGVDFVSEENLKPVTDFLLKQ